MFFLEEVSTETFFFCVASNSQMTMTEKNTNQEIGFIKVISSENIDKLIISQIFTVNEFNVVVAARKVFTFKTPDGEEVYRTEDRQFFRKKDGTVLKKIGYCQTNDCSMFRSGRQSQQPQI